MDSEIRIIFILITLVILVIAIIIALVILILNMIRMRRDNADLLKEVDTALNDGHYRKMQKVMDEADQRLKKHRHIADLKDKDLQAYVEEKFWELKLFKNPDITLKDAALSLGMTQEKLKSVFGADSPLGYFSDFITDLRLAEACTLLKEKPIYTIEAVAKDAGFSSRKTFQTRFKEKFIMTPSEFRLSQSSPNEKD